MTQTVHHPGAILLAALALVSCGGGGGAESPTSASGSSTSSSGCPSSSTVGTPTAVRPAGWSEATHGKDAATAYDAVFPPNAVTRFDLEISAACWQLVFDDLASKIGQSFPTTRSSMDGMGDAPGGGGGAPGGGGGAPGGGGGAPPGGGGGAPPGGGGAGGGDGELLSGTPVWVPVTLRSSGNVWTNVGMRIKGNSTLQQTWRAGIRKLPFRFKFDEFESAFPAIDNQRFYGLQKLSLTNNARDKSFLREKIVADVYREFGAGGAVRAARTGWVQIYITVGSSSPQYFGLYTLVEIPDEPFLTAQFGLNDGNLYKPQGSGANWAPRSSLATSTWRATFEKETNQDAADWNDVEAAVDALNASARTANPAQWRVELERRFNVDGFLRWLSVTGVVANWDTIGFIAHNYYLYGSPLDVPSGRLNWIPWDHDLTLERNSHNVTYPASSYPAPSWPLLRYLLDDPVYGPRYRQHVLEFLGSPQFDAASLQARFAASRALIQPHVTGAQPEQFGTTYSALDSASQFDEANRALVSFVAQRHATVCSQLGIASSACPQ
jgi:hypothetical protein